MAAAYLLAAAATGALLMVGGLLVILDRVPDMLTPEPISSPEKLGFAAAFCGAALILMAMLLSYLTL